MKTKQELIEEQKLFVKEASEFVKTYLKDHQNLCDVDKSKQNFANFIYCYIAAIRDYRDKVLMYCGPISIKTLIQREGSDRKQIVGTLDANLSLLSDARKELSVKIRRAKKILS